MSKKRKGISKKTRFEVFKRDGFKCQYCGRSAPEIVLEIDHIKPISKGGDNSLLNLLTSCFKCNRGKKDRELSDTTEISKQITQMQLVNEKRNQLEMLHEWQNELLNFEEETTEMISEIFEKLTFMELNATGKKIFNKYIKKYGYKEVVESLKIACDEYLIFENEINQNAYIPESVENAVKKVQCIIKTREKEREKPYLKDLYYIRGILKNRLILRYGFGLYYESIGDMEYFYLNGISIDTIKEISLSCNSYDDFMWSIDYNLCEVLNGQK